MTAPRWVHKVVPYVLVVAAAWGGSAYWYDQNEDRRQAAVEEVVGAAYAEDVDSCRRISYSLRRPINRFFDDVTESAKVRESLPELWRHARQARVATSQRDCVALVGEPPGFEVKYERDPGETFGIPSGEVERVTER